MGESVVEATVINWLKKEGERVEEDETVVEVATDKVDTEVPSPYAGTLIKILQDVDSVVSVGGVLAQIETDGPVKQLSGLGGESQVKEPTPKNVPSQKAHEEPTQDDEDGVKDIKSSDEEASKAITTAEKPSHPSFEVQKEDTKPVITDERYYSPLVRNIARTENISTEELKSIVGTGGSGRVTKDDIIKYLATRKQPVPLQAHRLDVPLKTQSTADPSGPKSGGATGTIHDAGAEILKMDRMRRTIADHMILSQQISAHVTSVVEADVTNMVRWRNQNKEDFERKYRTKLTFTPLFIECVQKAIHDFPKINSSVVGDDIHIKTEIHMGLATALDNGNLIVPVIKNSDELSLLGLAKKVNELSDRARSSRLSPDEVSGGTFTISNIGTFGNLIGTPIINQPQVAVLALGAIQKRPVVLETKGSDTIAIRHMMFLSLSFDHRIIDGFYGGSFLKRIGEYIENFDPNKKI